MSHRRPLVDRLRSLRPWSAALAATGLALTLAFTGEAAPGPVDDGVALSSAAADPSDQPLGTTSFRVASFNLLGAGHTDGANPQRKGWADSSKRLKWTRRILDDMQINLVGFQEMHPKQATLWTQRNSSQWGTFPGTKLDTKAGQNSISWRRSEFKVLRKRTIKIPYFRGVEQKMPYVMLQHKASGQRIWIYNVHNPANIPNNQQKWRDIGFARANKLVNRLRNKFPGVPVFMTGDMNDRDKFFCPTVAQTELEAANGGTASGSSCTPPQPMLVDWLLATGPNNFTGYWAMRTDLVRKTTDHPVIVATANIPSPVMQASRFKRVVVVTAEGVRRQTLLKATRRGDAKAIAATKRQGSSTFNARTAVESTQPLPNLVSILTGRTVDGSLGHGVERNTLSGTVHNAAGMYVSSTFDLVHNLGLKTRMLSSSDTTDPIYETWHAAGGGDPYGADNGRDKFTSYEKLASDRAVVRRFLDTRENGAAYTHLHLGEPREVGIAYGFRSSRYKQAIRDFDRNIALVRRALRKSSQLRGRTLLIIASTGGGDGRSDARADSDQNYRVPLFIKGPGVPAGTNLYDLNPAWASPRGKRVPYSSKAIHTGDIANLALAALRLPATPGSTLNNHQSFNVQALD
ncbi:hypothetical protein ncot_14400 [Nocardioides sp. JQ2195]|uniref:alkaline phosphatase family protein n=1 Tax=Nocardioides sp. JQ2195 TaxID=2592334 RepID=UPI00143EB6A3|nr:alkaline phosphatase family protein [Nocardioides sp. JQ2195]QIX27654.1 hypothetical protein ncot_14400 [Nocardioides sp. JQ2195]